MSEVGTAAMGDECEGGLDGVVGARIRFRRKLMRIPAAELARRLGISPQQLQKYETGATRVTAARLHELAQIFRVPLEFFFRPLPESGSALAADQSTEGATPVVDAFGSADAQEGPQATECVELLSLFVRVDRRNQRLILELLRSVARQP